uniref:Uncharacterized protein n=1 Tax=Anguilla anguilla TaxID=7936 RepID=A0A0E9WLP2_ANGAN
MRLVDNNPYRKVFARTVIYHHLFVQYKNSHLHRFKAITVRYFKIPNSYCLNIRSQMARSFKIKLFNTYTK